MSDSRQSSVAIYCFQYDNTNYIQDFWYLFHSLIQDRSVKPIILKPLSILDLQVYYMISSSTAHTYYSLSFQIVDLTTSGVLLEFPGIYKHSLLPQTGSQVVLLLVIRVFLFKFHRSWNIWQICPLQEIKCIFFLVGSLRTFLSI